MTPLGWLLVLDGAAFALIALVVLAAPSPQPALAGPLDPGAAVPFEDTRRLLASQFLGAGLLALLVGVLVHDTATLRLAAYARALTLLIVIAINTAQLRNGSWKRGPLYGLLAVFIPLCTAYLVLGAVS